MIIAAFSVFLIEAIQLESLEMSPNGHLPELASADDELQLSTLTCRHRYNESVAEVVHVLLKDNEFF
ncbi:MAG TPA: hypothetical protein DD473_12040 [Planctomycetaceae bacterium]|nr:hypothetical protein [Planctomycetaceae bacterium]